MKLRGRRFRLERTAVRRILRNTRGSRAWFFAKSRFSTIGSLALLGFLGWSGALLGSAASAQDLSSPSEAVRSTAAKVCDVFAFEESKEQPKQLRAICNGQVFFLGSVNAFQTIANEALKAQLIDVRFGEDRQIWLLTIQDDGQALREDLNGQIARAAGRGPMTPINGIDLDFSQFAQSGEIGIDGRSEDRARARAARIETAQQIALERSRRKAKQGRN